jgi:insulysin
MLEFYEQFIAPSSPTRAKLAVHMHAQTSASTIAAKTTPGEQAAGLEVKLVEYLESQHIPVDVEKLHIRLEKVDVLSGNTDSLIAAVSSYLVDDAKVPADTATQIIESATPLMGTVLASVGVQTTPDVDEEVEVAVGKATRVEDVHAFKSSLHVSPGPQPVKDITEFEDNEPKL